MGQNTQADKTDATAAGEKTVYFGACNSWDTLDPFAPVIIQQMFLNSCYQTLGVYDSYGGEVHGALMKSWKAVDDYTYDIELYDYARDVDGNPFSADDVVFCFNKAKESGNFSKLNYMDSMTKTRMRECKIPCEEFAVPVHDWNAYAAELIKRLPISR